MRILKAEITGFGRYHDQVIELSQEINCFWQQ